MSRERDTCLNCGKQLLPNQSKFCSAACRREQKEKSRIRAQRNNTIDDYSADTKGDRYITYGEWMAKKEGKK